MVTLNMIRKHYAIIHLFAIFHYATLNFLSYFENYATKTTATLYSKLKVQIGESLI